MILMRTFGGIEALVMVVLAFSLASPLLALDELRFRDRGSGRTW